MEKRKASIKTRTMCRNTVQSLHLLTENKIHKEEQQAKTDTEGSIQRSHLTSQMQEGQQCHKKAVQGSKATLD